MNYYKDLIKELGFDYLSLEKQEELVTEMNGIVYDRVILKILEMITDEEAINLSKLMEEKKEKEAKDFIMKKIPEFDKILKQEEFNFQQEIIQVVK
jgi:hypothetical protein